MPTYEPQFGEGWDTDGCTVWGTLNALEFLFNKIFGVEANFSERFTYNLVPVRPPGSDPHKVAETVRSRGVVDQTKLPMTETFEDFCLPDPMPADLLILGQQWLGKFGFGHEWVFKEYHDQEERVYLMKDALKYSPLGVSVTAWFQDNDGIYIDNGMSNSHWCVCFGWDDTKNAWKIFDSYDQSVKLYSFNSAISFCKRYALTELSESQPPIKRNWLWDLIVRLFSIFKPHATNK